jgi:hypothetical protein
MTATLDRPWGAQVAGFSPVQLLHGAPRFRQTGTGPFSILRFLETASASTTFLQWSQIQCPYNRTGPSSPQIRQGLGLSIGGISVVFFSAPC